MSNKFQNVLYILALPVTGDFQTIYIFKFSLCFCSASHLWVMDSEGEATSVSADQDITFPGGMEALSWERR